MERAETPYDLYGIDTYNLTVRETFFQNAHGSVIFLTAV
jgi:hypothetical protein